MNKTIDTLIPDIYRLVGGDHGRHEKDRIEERDDWFTTELAQRMASDIALRLRMQYMQSEKQTSHSLRLSQMGPRCPRALWYSIHHPDLAEALPPWAQVKFSFGHILEAFAVTLAKASGHNVTGEQDAVSVDGIQGHRDCVIDGCVVDVKSASSRSFAKFKDKSLRHNDNFGYLEQLDGYILGSREDPLVTVKDRGYLLAIDKTLGHMCLYQHDLREQHIRDRIERYKRIVQGDVPPACTCETRPSGKSGNVELGVTASYSAYKWQCFPNLRCFLYGTGPVYLTKVVRKPDVPEIDRYGKMVG